MTNDSMTNDLIISRRKSGYIAITSSIIIFGFVVALALAVGIGSFLTRNIIAGSYYKDISRALADAFSDTAFPVPEPVLRGSAPRRPLPPKF